MKRVSQIIGAALAVGITASAVFAYSFYTSDQAGQTAADAQSTPSSRPTLSEAEGRSLRRSAELLLQRVAGQFTTRPSETTQTTPTPVATPVVTDQPGATGSPASPLADRIAAQPAAPAATATPDAPGPVRIALTPVPTPAGTPTPLATPVADPGAQPVFVPTADPQAAATPVRANTPKSVRSANFTVFSRSVAWTGMCR